MRARSDQHNVRLRVGVYYDVAALEDRVLGVSWTEGDGSGHAGYDWGDYFDTTGQYFGADLHGIEPLFDIAGAEPVELANEFHMHCQVQMRQRDPRVWG